ncbi:unnamed protein product [Lupinus luteus]|uniref:Uncharacterized protein n=1 Tax=Lupinus luteus TaxID=3873 RepID=A0AAV1YH77_LUPLU
MRNTKTLASKSLSTFFLFYFYGTLVNTKYVNYDTGSKIDEGKLNILLVPSSFVGFYLWCHRQPIWVNRGVVLAASMNGSRWFSVPIHHLQGGPVMAIRTESRSSPPLSMT